MIQPFGPETSGAWGGLGIMPGLNHEGFSVQEGAQGPGEFMWFPFCFVVIF